MRPKQRILDVQRITTSKRVIAESARVIKFRRERLAAAEKAISTSQAREQRPPEREEKKAA